jgi:hypothetical protein
VPVWHRAYDGGADEVAQVVEAMTALKDLAGQRELLLVGDSKLLSRGNIVAMNTAKVASIAPASKTYLPTEFLGGLDIEQASPVDYVASRDAAKPPPSQGPTGCWRAPSPSRPGVATAAWLRLNPARGHDPPTIPTPAPLPARLLELLNVDPTRPRWAS